MFCEELFKGIKEKAGSGITFEVKFSMLEIYNEIARDLLDSKSGQKRLSHLLLLPLEKVVSFSFRKNFPCSFRIIGKIIQ